MGSSGKQRLPAKAASIAVQKDLKENGAVNTGVKRSAAAMSSNGNGNSNSGSTAIANLPTPPPMPSKVSERSDRDSSSGSDSSRSRRRKKKQKKDRKKLGMMGEYMSGLTPEVMMMNQMMGMSMMM